ncbi:hypothetical protein [Pelagibacterium luteolum]|uniref:Permease n=1 Tax=Pelagibacterium luteolum TaxID=440168 RepID=A0A1G7SXL7_9HYPH|nr:hypothetical protein [Pelagibacterium luteolum]SDG27731.1 hypothetical protein SAMN04487974_101792 [Pelagibacterium luteolum]
MTTSLIILFCLATAMTILVALRRPSEIPGAVVDMRQQLLTFGLRLPIALLAAAFVSQLVPVDLVGPYIGDSSGWVGILIATVFGAFIPGGPILTFPLALVIWRAGAGDAQMVSLLASWSIFAIHRVISYELPLLGGRFVVLRLLSSGLLPILAGFLALTLGTGLLQ